MATDNPDDLFEALNKLLSNDEISSLDEFERFAARLSAGHNALSNADFHGLSPEKMHRLLHFPFETPELLCFKECLDVAPTASVMALFDFLVETMGEKGLKATATGNLPRAVCRDASEQIGEHWPYFEWLARRRISKETDFFDLHVVRLLGGLAGLIRKHRSRFVLTRRCRDVLSKHGREGIYPILLQNYVRKYNWGFGDRYSDFQIVQMSFAFTLYLLARYGDEWRPQQFYEDCFLRAYPAVLSEAEDWEYMSGERQVRSCFTLRALLRFAEFFGLVEVERIPVEFRGFDYRIKSAPLLDRVVTFKI